MINLLVDEAYAFDYLSILEIKMSKFPEQGKKFRDCLIQLLHEIQPQSIMDILESQEYHNLRRANEKTFNAVDKARYGEITAKEVDECNMERYHAKVALQKKFFNTEVTEYKN